MGETSIEWTDDTWNPVRGCRIISPGCKNCYAMKLAHRYSGPGRAYEGLTRHGVGGVKWTGEARFIPDKLLEPLSWRKPRRVFVNSMSDLFHEDITFEEIDQIFAVMANAPQHTFQVLTKRTARMAEWANQQGPFGVNVRGTAFRMELGDSFPWPLPNVWMGTSTEDQTRFAERFEYLVRTPAAVRFLSVEPMLGPIDLGLLGILPGDWVGGAYVPAHDRLDWVIVGGESGSGARSMDLAWARSLIQQCAEAGVACFMKQLGSKPRGSSGCVMPWVGGDDKKGGEMAKWSDDLRVRQWPEVRS